MGNEWDEIDRKSSLKCKCPCGAGGYYTDTITYRDDYMRTKDEYENYMTCSKCNEKYILKQYGWIDKSDYIEYTKITQRNNTELNRIHKILLDKYHTAVISHIQSIRTKKALYQLFSRNNVVLMHGTLETFRKHLNKYGLNSYIKEVGSLNRIDGFISIIKEIGLGLDSFDMDMLEKYEVMKNEAKEYLKANCIQTIKS